MQESLIDCPRCSGNACHEVFNNKLTVWSCFGCGFTSNSTLTEEKLEEVESVIPQLYKDLRFQDLQTVNVLKHLIWTMGVLFKALQPVMLGLADDYFYYRRSYRCRKTNN